MTQTAFNIVSPNTSKNFPKTWNDEPVGTGAYKWKSRTKGADLILERNEDYWGKKPYYKTAAFKIVPEAATRESLILANQADVIILPPPADIPKLQANTALKVLLAPSNRTIFIGQYCTREGPTKNVKFRQALNYAVDKEGIIKSILFGAADVMDAPVASMPLRLLPRSAPIPTIRPRPSRSDQGVRLRGRLDQVLLLHRPLRAGRAVLAGHRRQPARRGPEGRDADDGLADLPGHRQRGAGQGLGRHLRPRLGARLPGRRRSRWCSSARAPGRRTAWPPRTTPTRR